MRKTALITGASSGIGQGIAKAFAREGYDMVITYAGNPQGAEETRAEVEKLNAKCYIMQASLHDPQTPQRLCDEAVKALGHIDVLILNAGRDARSSILSADLEHLRYIVESNFYGNLLLCGAVARHMVANKIAGNIQFITSTRGECAHPDDFLYGGIKAALNRACKSIAMELSRYNIRVNCVAPGATRVREHRPPKLPAGTELNGKKFYPIDDAIPLKRMGTPEDCAELVAFLASDKASYITGITIRIDGGLALPSIPEWFAPAQWLDERWADNQKDIAFGEKERTSIDGRYQF